MSRIPESETSARGVAAVDRALAIVDAVARRTEPITLADLAHATGYYKSTILRLITSLEKATLLVRRSDGRYGLGSYTHQLGRAFEATYRITEIVLPILHQLVDQGTESASFHVYHDPEFRICLLRVDSHHSTLDRIRVGDLLPLNKGAAGRLLTASVARKRFTSAADLTLVSMGERDPNCSAVACPVFGSDGDMCGAISLSGPKERFTAAAIKKMSRQALQAAQTATQTLGGPWPIL